MIKQRSFGRLLSFLLTFSMLLAGALLAGCSDEHSTYNVHSTSCCNCNGNCNCNGGCNGNCNCNGNANANDNGNGNGNNNDGQADGRNRIHYLIPPSVVVKAVDAGATLMGGFAYDDNGLIDSNFSLAEQEIGKMGKAENGNYLAELNVSDNVKHVELYFYYENGDDKLATGCKHINLDFSSTTNDNDTIVDSDANNASFTIKTYDSTGRETSNFAPGDKIFAKVFITCPDQDCSFESLTMPNAEGNDETFTVSSLVSSDADVAAPSSQESDEYLLCDALADGTASLYVNNFGFTCLFSKHEVNVKD